MKRRKKYPDEGKLKEYFNHMQAVDALLENMPDRAWFQALENQTEYWLVNNKFGSLDPNDFLHKHYLSIS